MSALQLRARRQKSASDDGMLPMINIVFLLLVFFMVAGQITATQPQELQLPASASVTEAEVNGVEISVDAAGVIWLGGTALTGDIQPQLQQHIVEEADLTIRVHHSLNASTFDPILRVLRGAKVSHVRLFTEATQ